MRKKMILELVLHEMKREDTTPEAIRAAAAHVKAIVERALAACTIGDGVIFRASRLTVRMESEPDARDTRGTR